MRKRLSHLVCSRFQRGRILPFSVAALMLIFLVLPLYAEWQKDYESAMDLIKKNQWQAAIPKLQAAISDKPDEGSNIKFYGMKFGDYFPHYYLGWAYFNLKNYSAALNEFQQSEKYGSIQRKRDLAEKMSGMMSLSRAQMSATAPTTTPAVVVPPAIQVAKSEPPPEEKKQEPEVTQPIQEEKKVEEKKVPIEEATRVVPETKEPEKSVQPEQKPQTPVVPPVDVNAENAKFVVKNGAKKYFEGDYDGAIYMLQSAIEASPNNAAAQFLLGCAYASKYLLSGSQEKQFLDNASAAFQKTKQISPSYRVKNKNVFSPAVLALFEKSS